MKIISICSPGLEDIAALEVKELCKVESILRDGAIIFETTKEKILDYCYLAQAPYKILAHLEDKDFNTQKDIEKFTEKINLSEWINANTTFKAICTREGKHNFTSEEIARKTGDIIQQKTNLQVNLTTPDILVHFHIQNNNCYVGIDLTKLDHSKRDYKLFSPPETLKATIAFALIKLAKYAPKEKLLNIFTGSGVIAIEAALSASKKSINYYQKNKLQFQNFAPFKETYFEGYYDKLDKKVKMDNLQIYAYDNTLSNVKSAQKNSKISGISKIIHISKVDTEWLDTKFEENEIDKIVTYLPSPSKRKEDKVTKKIYTELFYQTEFILNPKGLLVTAIRNNKLLLEAQKESKIQLVEERQIMQGKCPLYINIFKK